LLLFLHLSDASAGATTEEEEALIFEIYNCPDGSYNPLASLWFTSAELSLKHLFVQSAPKALGAGPLVTFFVLYYTLACFTAGTWIAAGLLVPMLIMGASSGRLFGVILSIHYRRPSTSLH
jgi:H+/Cl- antiporter ClcA